MKINVVTSFNENLYNKFGTLFFKSIYENWEPTIKVKAYYHKFPADKYSLEKHIDYSNLEEHRKYKRFVKENADHNGTENGNIPYNDKLDAIKWSHKMFALTDHAFTLAEKDKEPGWLIWVDVDSYATKRLTQKDLENILTDNVDIVHTGNHSFIAFNLNKKPPLDLLWDLRRTYMNGEVIQYREWTDSFILERLLNIYKAHGLKIYDARDIIPNYILHMEGVSNSSILPLRDSKGNRIFNLSKDKVSQDIVPARYTKNAEIIRHFKPKTILETGTWNGGRAIEMALAAFENTDKVDYYGFDLFEDATIETDKEEFNVKAHNTMEAVNKRLEEFKVKMKEKNKIFNFVLTKGNTRETLKASNLFEFLPDIDYAFIGGGDSITTKQSDYDCLKHIPVIVVDNFFAKDKDGNTVKTEYCGTNKLKDNLPKDIKNNILPSEDLVRGGGNTHLLLIVKDDKLPSPPRHLFSVPIKVNPRDCVPKEDIRGNIKTNFKLINRWLGKFPMHDNKCIIVSGGPYTDYAELHALIKSNPTAKIVAVKHSYRKLLEHNIKPWACVVLDPRPITGTSTHGVVRKDLFKTIDPSTKFFVASMTDPSVTEYLIERKADIWGWHAFTESLRDPEEQKKGIHNNVVTLNKDLGLPEGTTLITGGTCAAMRALGIMHTMGFRFFELFGYDSSVEEPTEEQKKETTGAEDENPRPKYFKVSVGKEEFWTTGELLALAQDCEKYFNESPMEMDINFHGQGTLVSALWKLSNRYKLKQQSFQGDL
mgnify:FL=1|jgi:hypothetical protein